jgi:hypothetical protein
MSSVWQIFIIDYSMELLSFKSREQSKREHLNLQKNLIFYKIIAQPKNSLNGLARYWYPFAQKVNKSYLVRS